MVMDDLDKIHEDGQATMLVDVSRSLQSPDCLNVSTPHYGAFITGDIVAERYYGQIGRRANKRNNAVRLFCKNDLITPLISDDILKSKKFELDSELEVFYHDEKLQELLTRIVIGKTSETDWLYNRPNYLSRVHESFRTREEFEQFKRFIHSNDASGYLKDKKDMNLVVSNHLRDRF